MSDAPTCRSARCSQLLQDEFPDVTISKIRFLESQGLIDPERTPSGYRKFYDADIERLKFILREQKDSYLPLKVIKDRLDAGEGTGPVIRPLRWRRSTVVDGRRHRRRPAARRPPPPGRAPEAEPPPAAAGRARRRCADGRRPARWPATSRPSRRGAGRREAALMPSSSLTFDELVERVAGSRRRSCARWSATASWSAARSGRTTYYDDEALVIARLVAGFLRYGIEPRHLRMYRNAAEREAGVFEQVILPLVKQRNPQARVQALASLAELTQLGSGLRDAMCARPCAATPTASRTAGTATALAAVPPRHGRGRRTDGVRRRWRRRTIAAMVPMELVGVRLELPANTPIVILRETEGRRRVVPIYIGGPEAAAIHYALEGIEPARPLTHDLLKNVLDELTTSLDRVVVTEVRDRTYYAELHLVNAGRRPHRVEPAVRRHRPRGADRQTPIFAEESVLDEVGQEQDETEPAAEGDEDELLEDFRDFIENVKPEDFERRLSRVRRPSRPRVDATRSVACSAHVGRTAAPTVIDRRAGLRTLGARPHRRNYVAVVRAELSEERSRMIVDDEGFSGTRTAQVVGHQLPPARLLGPHRPHPAVAGRRHRQRQPAPVLLPRPARAEGDQEAARRRHQPRVGAGGLRLPARAHEHRRRLGPPRHRRQRRAAVRRRRPHQRRAPRPGRAQRAAAGGREGGAGRGDRGPPPSTAASGGDRRR